MVRYNYHTIHIFCYYCSELPNSVRAQVPVRLPVLVREQVLFGGTFQSPPLVHFTSHTSRRTVASDDTAIRDGALEKCIAPNDFGGGSGRRAPEFHDAGGCSRRRFRSPTSWDDGFCSSRVLPDIPRCLLWCLLHVAPVSRVPCGPQRQRCVGEVHPRPSRHPQGGHCVPQEALLRGR